MITSAATFGSLNLTQGAKAHVVRSTAVVSTLRDRRRRSRAEHAMATVALAPAAMAALIEAQERFAQEAQVEIDQLCSCADEATVPPSGLSQGPVDFQT